MTVRGVVAVALAGWLTACGANGHDTADDTGRATPPAGAGVVAETLEADRQGSTGDLVLVPVELPPDFPAEFPIAPESTVVEASARHGSTGTWSAITIVAPGEPEAIFVWYQDALERGGWSVQVGASSPFLHVLHAMLGESYLDLATEPHPADPASGWARTHAEIWKIHP